MTPLRILLAVARVAVLMAILGGLFYVVDHAAGIGALTTSLGVPK